ncbi:hypothetical protein PG985_015164 [Apiospora marii]|uniref:uncharacterized protein n=1 Tax=Apiospora marii TaxID=335849 RepID=UPI00312E71B5
MTIFGWCTRRAGGLAMLATISLSYWVITREAATPGLGYIKYWQSSSLGIAGSSVASADAAAGTTGAGLWTAVFAYYCLFIHVLVTCFPIRSCWSIFDLTRSLKKMARSKALRDIKISETLTSSRDGSAFSSTLAAKLAISNSICILMAMLPTPTTSSTPLLSPTTRGSRYFTGNIGSSCISSPSTIYVYLGMEQREHNVELKAMNLIQEFAKKFRSIHFTLHPSDIPGESPGKGSNMAWAARKLSEKYPLAMRKDVIVTGIDGKTTPTMRKNHPPFGPRTILLCYHRPHFSHPKIATTTLYAAPIIFDRNAHNIPAVVRVGDIPLGWCRYVWLVQRFNDCSSSTSVYSVPLQLVDRVGGWDSDAKAIGEDLHMYLKCFFALNGNLTVRTVLSPMSQTNVKGDGGEGVGGVYNDVKARYKQAPRHMWGALDSGYAIRKFAEVWQERKHTSRAFRPLHMTMNDPSDDYIPQIDGLSPEQTVESGIFSDVTTDTLKDPNWSAMLYLPAHPACSKPISCPCR